LHDLVGPFLVAFFFDEFGEGEGGLLLVFSVLDVCTQVFNAVAVDATLYDEIYDRGQLLLVSM
jgi:hypothetical protein